MTHFDGQFSWGQSQPTTETMHKMSIKKILEYVLIIAMILDILWLESDHIANLIIKLIWNTSTYVMKVI